MKNTTETSALSLLANDAGYDPLEDRLRENISFSGAADTVERTRFGKGIGTGTGSGN